MTSPEDTELDLPPSWRALATTLAMAWRQWPLGVGVRVAAMATMQITAGLGQGVALKRVLETSLAGQPSAPWLAVLVLMVWQPWAPGAFFEHVQAVLLRRNSVAVANTMLGASLAHAGIEHLEDPVFADRIASVRQRAAEIPALFDTFAHLLGAAVALVASAAVLASLHPLLLVPLPLAVALAVIQRRARRRSERLRDGSLPDQRLAAALTSVATDASSAPHVRLHDMGPWLLTRHRQATAEVARRALRGELGVVIATGLTGAGQALVLSASLIYALLLTRAGSLSPGDMALGFMLLRAALDAAATTATGAAGLTPLLHTARQYLWLIEHQSAVTTPIDPAPTPTQLETGITIEGVTFRYRKDQPSALDDVSLQFAPGTVVALVGNNGAGKSTLVKLLLRMYDPDSGRITVDRTDLRQLDPDEWRSRVTGAFQNHARFEFLAREAVGAGDVAHIDDVNTVRAAAESGGAHALIARLPGGYETQLGREHQGGSQLSAGEWQRVAMSRGAMRRAPLLLVLDEPTAALDPRAEHDLFERFAARSELSRASGAITILVSHRFSTVRMADVIIVMDRGHIIEQGTHDQLIALAGKYASAYEMQSQRYL